MTFAEARLTDALKARMDAGLYRHRRIIDSPQGTHVTVEGRRMLSFCSNDYLGLANHPDIINALQDGAGRYGVGSGASHLVSGHSTIHHELECSLARFTGRPRALLFSSGYMANLGIQAALFSRGDTVYHDRLNHASLLDGSRMAGCKPCRFPHLENKALSSLLQKHSPGSTAIVSDGVFSMDGDLANLKQLALMASRHKATLIIDDAHGLGILGKGGRGSCEYWDVDDQEIPILMGTLGKAFGTMGAFVAGSEALIETLIQHARTYIYTTAIPPAIAYATLASLEIIQGEPQRRIHLAHLSAKLTRGIEALGLKVPESCHMSTPIVPVLIGASEAATEISNALAAQGILVTAIRPPTVPAGTARLRVTLSAPHTETHIERLLEALDRCR